MLPAALPPRRRPARATSGLHPERPQRPIYRLTRLSRTPDRPAASARGAAMIGMVLVTHGRLADEFIAALEHVVGAQTQIAAICIGADDDMEQRRQDILRTIGQVDTGDGVNLPMLIKLASLRQHEGLEKSVLGAQEAGRKYINVASQLLADARK